MGLRAHVTSATTTQHNRLQSSMRRSHQVPTSEARRRPLRRSRDNDARSHRLVAQANPLHRTPGPRAHAALALQAPKFGRHRARVLHTAAESDRARTEWVSDVANYRSPHILTPLRVRLEIASWDVLHLVFARSPIETPNIELVDDSEVAEQNEQPLCGAQNYNSIPQPDPRVD